MADTKLERFYRTVPSVFNPKSNDIVNGLLQAWASEDETINTTELENVKNSLFVQKATGIYLDLLASNYKILRPDLVALTDSLFRELIIALSYSPKQIRKTMYDILDVFWGPTYSRANLTCTTAENYNMGTASGLTGTLSFTKDSVIVSGTGTLFTSELAVGDYIKLSSQANSLFLKVVKINSNTQLRVFSLPSSTYSGSSVKLTSKNLTLKIDDETAAQDITVNPKFFTDTTAVTAAEMVSALNNELTTATASTIRLFGTSSLYVNLRTNTPGIKGSVEVTGGTLNSLLSFSTSRVDIDSLSDRKTVIYNTYNREIVIELPRIVARLTRTLLGAYHTHESITGTITAIDNTAKTITVNLSEAVTTDQLANKKFGSSIYSFTIQSHTSGTTGVVFTFDTGDDLSVLIGNGAYLHTQSSSNSTWTVTHNLGQQYVNFEIYDTNGNILTPSTVTATDSNTLTITFGGAQTGYCAVAYGISGEFYEHTQSVSSATWTITHSLNQKYNNVTVYDSSDQVVLSPTRVEALSDSQVEVELSAPDTGKVIISEGGNNGHRYLHTESASTSRWDISHLLSSKYVCFTAYDSSDQKVSPSSGVTTNDDEISLSFSSNDTGNVAVTSGENIKTMRIVDSSYPNSFVFSPDGAFYPTKNRAILDQTVSSGSIVSLLSVIGGGSIPNESGYLCIDYGKGQQEGPIPYVARVNNTTLILDPSYAFTKNHGEGEFINFVKINGYEPNDDGTDYAVYATAVKSALTDVQDILEKIKAAGVIFRYIINEPEYRFERGCG